MTSKPLPRTIAHRYRTFVDSFDPARPTMPVVHSCFGRQFQRIMDTGMVVPGGYDEVIECDASFFFYAKPSYRPRNDGRFRRSLKSALFCLVLDLDALHPPTGVLPFDSGGYAKIFGDTQDGIPPLEFLLAPNNLTPGRLVSAFFGTNNSYFRMSARESIKKEIQAMDFHSQTYLDICSDAAPTDYDQRAASIELHYEAPLPLNQRNVLALAAPDVACDDAELKDFAAGLRAELIPYDLDLDDTHSRQRQVRDAVGGWLRKKGYFAE